MFKSVKFSAIALAGFLGASAAQAGLITNGSFEADPGLGVIYHDPIPANTTYDEFSDYMYRGVNKSWAVVNPNSSFGWKMFHGQGIELQNSGNLGFAAQDGNRYIELDTHFAYNAPGNSNVGIYQDLTNLQVGATYELSFWYRARTDIRDDSGLGLFWKDGTTALNIGDWDFIYDYYDRDYKVVGSTTEWKNYTVQLVATAANMKIGFAGLGNALWGGDTNQVGGGSAKGALLDNVSLKQVSEPGTFAMLMLAGLALVTRRRKA